MKYEALSVKATCRYISLSVSPYFCFLYSIKLTKWNTPTVEFPHRIPFVNSGQVLVVEAVINCVLSNAVGNVFLGGNFFQSDCSVNRLKQLVATDSQSSIKIGHFHLQQVIESGNGPGPFGVARLDVGLEVLVRDDVDGHVAILAMHLVKHSKQLDQVACFLQNQTCVDKKSSKYVQIRVFITTDVSFKLAAFLLLFVFSLKI